ncbi:hypothetical protein CP49_23880 [Bradyrhizobium valentinum]|uniref:Uncharacterized protein n=1 Tax=Bradyrhizobium valentinum TaxID=1518501 RepID=A0A0R3L8M0_9BRAD|nr:hypothetical protein CP49_23880 [Bradyrhizobium valentinum]
MSKPKRPDVIRANLVLVWHAGQSGRMMIMMLRLGSGGSVTELSVTGRYQGGGDGISIELLLCRRWSILLTFEKLMRRDAPQWRVSVALSRG